MWRFFFLSYMNLPHSTCLRSWRHQTSCRRGAGCLFPSCLEVRGHKLDNDEAVDFYSHFGACHTCNPDL